MATAKPSSARASVRTRPIRCAPPVTSAALGIGGTASAPVSSSASSASPTGTALLSGSHLGAGHVARRHPGAAGGRTAARTISPPHPDPPFAYLLDGQTEIGLLEPADLVAQPRRLFEFEIGCRLAHPFFEIGDDGLQIGALIMRRFALRQSKRHVIALVNTLQDVGDAAAHA